MGIRGSGTAIVLAFMASACSRAPSFDPCAEGWDCSDGGINPTPDASSPDAGPNRDAGPSDVSGSSGESGRLLIRARAVITMTERGVIAPGEVYTVDGKIGCVGAVGECDAMSSGASAVDSSGIVIPGLVDAHNHVAYNWLPEWTPGRLWDDHSQWQASSEYDVFIEPHSANKSDAASFCAMLQWGELRSLVNGTTTVFGAPQARTCIRWLVRNAELSTAYNGWTQDRMRSNTLGIDTVNAQDAADLGQLMNDGSVTAYMIHLAEGISSRAHDEFTDLVGLGLLRPETVIIHGTALTPGDLAQVGSAGAKLVWSPSSNMALYGETTDIPAALSAGVSISLAADWTPSGEDDLLHEARFARGLAAQRWPGMLDDRRLLEMLTRIPAEQMGLSEFVGALEPGRFADLVILDRPDGDPEAQAILANPEDIQLVLIGGVPSYGDPELMRSLPDTPSSCSTIDACGRSRLGCWEDPPSGPTTPDQIEAAIQQFFPDGPVSLFTCDSVSR